MEIPSSQAGVVKELKVKLGDKVKEGSVLVVLEVQALLQRPAGCRCSRRPLRKLPLRRPGTASPPANGGSGAKRIEIRVPDIGDFKDVAVIELLVKPGDTVKAEQSLLTVESDKASMEIPSSAAGVIKELKVKLGDKVNAGDLIAVLEGSAAASAPAVQAGARSAGGHPGAAPQRPSARHLPRPCHRMSRAPPPASCRMHRHRCASSPANWAFRSKK